MTGFSKLCVISASRNFVRIVNFNSQLFQVQLKSKLASDLCLTQIRSSHARTMPFRAGKFYTKVFLDKMVD